MSVDKCKDCVHYDYYPEDNTGLCTIGMPTECRPDEYACGCFIERKIDDPDVLEIIGR